jgi:Recombinase
MDERGYVLERMPPPGATRGYVRSPTEQEQAATPRIVELYEAGRSLWDIACTLNAEGRRKYKRRWRAVDVALVLRTQSGGGLEDRSRSTVNRKRYT